VQFFSSDLPKKKEKKILPSRPMFQSLQLFLYVLSWSSPACIVLPILFSGTLKKVEPSALGSPLKPDLIIV
jgi:hypothetical protein